MENNRDLLSTLNHIKQQLQEKVAQRDLLNVQIMQLEQNFKSLNAMAIQDRLVNARLHQQQAAVGLTEAIRTVMRTTRKPMTPADVKTALAMAGFDLKRFKNPSAAIHNTLIRMAESGRVKYVKSNRAYRLPDPFYGEF